MSDLLVIVPSRGRPEAAHELVKVFEQTCTANTELRLVVDADDPTIDDYPASALIRQPDIDTTTATPNTMVAALNWAIRTVPDTSVRPFAVGFMGDDHRPRTVGWDALYLTELRKLGTGLVYGNDLLQKGRLPTQIAMTWDIVWAIGYMAPPTLRHLYVDNWWRDLGNGAECLSYLPDVVVEHLHPIANKAEWDAGYRRVNNDSAMMQDRNTYREYVTKRLQWDIETVAGLRTR